MYGVRIRYIIVATQRLPRDFGRVVQQYVDDGRGQEHEITKEYEWRAGTQIKELSPQSEWVITLWGTRTDFTPRNAARLGAEEERDRNYHIALSASLLVDDTIRLVLEGEERHLMALTRLSNRLWMELEKEGYIKAPTVTDQVPKARPAPVKPWEAIPNVGWNRRAVELWHAGYTAAEIAQKVDRDLTPKTVSNVISQLRRIYGTEVVPERRSNPGPGRRSSKKRE